MKFKFGPVTVKLIEEGDRIVQSVHEGRGPFEKQTREKWAHMCMAGGTAIDVGCYSGMFAIAASMMGCDVVAFEPMPANVERILQNVALNKVPNINLVVGVASDRDGRAEITFNPKVRFTSGASLIRKKGEKLNVPSLMIDSLKLKDVTSVKIDVERAEPMVLRGMVETIRRCQPVLIVEALGEAEANAVMEVIEGYHVTNVLDTRNLILEPV